MKFHKTNNLIRLIFYNIQRYALLSENINDNIINIIFILNKNEYSTNTTWASGYPS